MRRVALALVGLAIAGTLGFGLLAWRSEIAVQPGIPPSDSLPNEGQIEAGARLALLGNCASCQTTEGGEALTGGLAIETPFGSIYSTNITPDRDTGIGDWSLAAYSRAMREGVDREGRHLYPAFPYEYFARISDADMADLYAWNMAQTPAAARTPSNDLIFPAGFRPLLAGWKLLFHSDTRFEASPAQSRQWNEGAYLAEGLGHCGACHMPRNALGGVAEGRADEGGEAYVWWAPPLTAANPAPHAWTEHALFSYLRTGRSLAHGVAAGPMAAVVHDSLAFVPEADVAPLAHYLGDRMARQTSPEPHNRVRPHPGQVDAMGQPMPVLTYQIEPCVSRARGATLENYARIAALLGGTEVEFSTDYGGNNHIMGTTIMGADPATSVVDADCRSHDHPNLFIGGPSVLSTGGTVNCGLTIAALALRLADTMVSET